MANEMKYYVGTTKTVEANGASTANNVMTQADDAGYGAAADGGNYLDAEIVGAFTFGTAPTANTTIDVYARENDIDSTNDAQVPTTTYKPCYIGSFVVNAVTTAQYCKFIARDVPRTPSDYYIHNNATGQTISAGWTLKITPLSLGPV